MSGRAKFLVFAFLLLFPCAGNAAPLDGYYAARDGYIAKFKNANTDDATDKLMNAALDELAVKLRAIVGSLDAQGLPKTGAVNLDTLSEGDQGFGTLDGLLFSSEKNNTSVVVSTLPILEHWLKEHADWWGPTTPNVAQGAGAAIRDESFYTQALKTDAAFFRFAEIPVAKPAGAIAVYAMLVGRAQDNGLETPNELIVTKISNGKIYIVSVPAVGEFAAFPACKKVWQDAQEKALKQEQSAIDDKNGDAVEEGGKVRDDGYAAYLKCFAEHAKGEKYFPALSKQAQEWVDMLSSK